MKYDLPSIEEYEKLIPVVKMLYAHTNNLSWQLLLPLFLISVCMSYSSDLGFTGSVIVKLKRLIQVALLLVTFPMIAEFAQSLGVEIAKSIDDLTGIDAILKAAAKNAEGLSLDFKRVIDLGAGIFMLFFVYLSFLILAVARFFIIAYQHFYWFLLVVVGPFCILGHLFESTSVMTRGLFKNMLQVAAWPIIWAILSAFMRSLPFATVYTSEGNFVSVITMNLIIACALFKSSSIVSELTEGAGLSIGNTMKRGVGTALDLINPTGLAIKTAGAVVGMKRVNNARRFFQTPKIPKE